MDSHMKLNTLKIGWALTLLLAVSNAQSSSLEMSKPEIAKANSHFTLYDPNNLYDPNKFDVPSEQRYWACQVEHLIGWKHPSHPLQRLFSQQAAMLKSYRFKKGENPLLELMNRGHFIYSQLMTECSHETCPAGKHPLIGTEDSRAQKAVLDVYSKALGYSQ